MVSIDSTRVGEHGVFQQTALLLQIGPGREVEVDRLAKGPEDERLGLLVEVVLLLFQIIFQVRCKQWIKKLDDRLVERNARCQYRESI